jgi:hypothetical protein
MAPERQGLASPQLSPRLLTGRGVASNPRAGQPRVNAAISLCTENSKRAPALSKSILLEFGLDTWAWPLFCIHFRAGRKGM